MTERFTRSFDFTVTRADDETRDGLTLEGYAAVFDTPTEIHDRLGAYTETIAPGAFKKTISERTPVLQFDHGTHPMIGSIPLGVVQTIREDEHGLFVRARLSDNWLVEPVRHAIQDGGVHGMSFQFAVTRDDWNEDQTARTVREVKLYEVGPVVWPAYETTTVGVRGDILRTIYSDNENVTFDAATRTSEDETDTPPSAPVVTSEAVDTAARIARIVAAPSPYLGG